MSLMSKNRITFSFYFLRYPLDAKIKPSTRGHEFQAVDGDILRELALTYSEQYPEMHSGNGCGSKTSQFPSGVTNGAGWRERPYSLQDYAYLDLNILTITPHIHCCHYVNEAELPKLYKDNEPSLLAMLEKVRQAVKGDVSDKLRMQLENAYLTVHGRKTVINVTKDYGSFYRLLPQGTYKLIAHAPGYSSVIKEVSVLPEVKTNVMFSLNKFVTNYKYHKPEEINDILSELSSHCPNIMRMYTIGKTGEGRAIQVVEMSDNPGISIIQLQHMMTIYFRFSVKSSQCDSNPVLMGRVYSESR